MGIIWPQWFLQGGDQALSEELKKVNHERIVRCLLAVLAVISSKLMPKGCSVVSAGTEIRSAWGERFNSFIRKFRLSTLLLKTIEINLW